jgi:hypothetical protein
MIEKTASKYLTNLEKHFANDNPVLLKSAKVFQDLDQIEFDLGLISIDETTANKNSWWPIICLISGNSSAKSRFINSYLTNTQQVPSGTQVFNQKFSVLLHNSQANAATLPGTALDVDPRYPFYQISNQIEQLLKGEGDRVNSYLELKTMNCERLKGKVFIDTPNISAEPLNPIHLLLSKQSIDCADLVFVFSDAFDTSSPMQNELIEQIISQQDSNKFVYLIDEPLATLNPAKTNEIIGSWQRKLLALGLNTGQFIIMPTMQNNINPNHQADFYEIDERITNVNNARTYRVLDALEKNIRDIENVVIPEVKKAIATWKERANITSLFIVSFIAILAVFAEIEFGVLDFLFDPIIGPIILVVLLLVLAPTHLLICKLHAKFIVKKLNLRQKELNLMENLANLFEKNLTTTRMLLSTSEPMGWNQDTKARLMLLTNKTKELVQSLNDDFSDYENEEAPH